MGQKQRLRLIIAAVFLGSLVFFYGFNDGTASWFWVWPLLLAIVIYNFLLWGERCPACKREFALEAMESDTFRTTWQCRYCEHRLKRLNMRPNP